MGMTNRSFPDNAVELDCPTSGGKRVFQEQVKLEDSVENEDRLLSVTGKDQENHVEDDIIPLSSNHRSFFKMRTTEVQNKTGREIKKGVKVPLSSRYVVHSRNHLVWDQEKEEHSDCVFEWMALRSRYAIEEFTDITPGEKEFFSVWNQWLLKLGQDVGRLHLGRILSSFVAEEGRHVMRRGLHRQFVLHLLNLEQENLLGVVQVIRLTKSMQKIDEENQHM